MVYIQWMLIAVGFLFFCSFYKRIFRLMENAGVPAESIAERADFALYWNSVHLLARRLDSQLCLIYVRTEWNGRHFSPACSSLF
ncbi:hypothetical protein LR69_02431 [Geobacillus sp. BCO2]|nr:hypothetical protein LR69_02431 [Geobacillus sp. BCO2]